MRKGGLVLLVALVVLFSTTNASDVVWGRLSQLEGQCYIAIGRYSPKYSTPACRAVGVAVSGLAQGAAYARSRAEDWYYVLMGKTGADRFVNMLAEVKEQLGSFTNSDDGLVQIARRGPAALHERYASISDSATMSFKQSVDSYMIGQNYLQAGGNDAVQALPWLEYGAKQPMGLGVFSQMSLGQLYLKGAPGVQASPELSLQYLEQAKVSLRTLQSAKTPQAARMLSAMNASPDATIREIDRLILQIRQGQFSPR